LILIDLDCPKANKIQRLTDNYEQSDWSRIFLMIQKMEAWILSQPDKIEEYGFRYKFLIPKGYVPIANNSLLKNKHPEEIDNPDEVLKTIFRQYFKVVRKAEGKPRPKIYSKSKDAPGLIMLLDSIKLRSTFDEFDNLITKINSTNDPH